MGVVLIAAALAKAASPGKTRFVIEYALGGVGASTPAHFSHWLVAALVVFEILLGVWLLSGWRARAARRVALGTLGLFTVFLAALVLNPAAPPCACTGWIRLADNAHTANLLGVGRNLVLIALLAAAPAQRATPLRVAASP